MVGIIVVGHGSFASGISSSLFLIGGQSQNYSYVDFLPDDSVDELTKKIGEAVNNMSQYNEILIMTDIVGGSPFNVSSKLKMEETKKNIEVVGGLNLPMLVEISISSAAVDSASDLASTAVNSGKNNILMFKAVESNGDDDEFDE